MTIQFCITSWCRFELYPFEIPWFIPGSRLPDVTSDRWSNAGFSSLHWDGINVSSGEVSNRAAKDECLARSLSVSASKYPNFL
jgi:hypothetical protein